MCSRYVLESLEYAYITDLPNYYHIHAFFANVLANYLFFLRKSELYHLEKLDNEHTYYVNNFLDVSEFQQIRPAFMEWAA